MGKREKSMGKLAEKNKVKAECIYGDGKNGNQSCICCFCDRKRGCFQCLECKEKGNYKPIGDCDMIIDESIPRSNDFIRDYNTKMMMSGIY